MKWDEQRDLLLKKAVDDEKAMRVLIADSQSPDTTIGFHAQQAVEKYLKALLCHLKVNYRRTHDLVELMDALVDAGSPPPPEVDNAKHLQPYAVQFRYDDIPTGSTVVMDRLATSGQVNVVRDWVNDRQTKMPASP